MESNLQKSESNNILQLEGIVSEELTYSHEIYDEKFYTFVMNVCRLSEKCDEIKITISEKLLFDVKVRKGERVRITGQIRSYNKFDGGKNRLILTAFARDITTDFENSADPNSIVVEGYICKKPVFRVTPLGREISDILLAVNRAYNKSDYIPVISWGRNARFSKVFEVGDKIRVHGRFQSRNYDKQLPDGSTEKKTAYEVSVSKLEKISGSDFSIGAEADDNRNASVNECTEINTRTGTEILAATY